VALWCGQAVLSESETYPKRDKAKRINARRATR